MKTRSFVITCCAAALLMPFSVSAQEAKKYDLKDRPGKVGDKAHRETKATLEKSRKVTQGDKTLKEDSSDLKVELSGDVEILEVSESGKTKKLTFKVGKFILKEGEDPEEEALKAGTVITATGGEARTDTFEVDGKELKGRTAEVLNELFSLSGNRKKRVDENAIFGMNEPRAAGTEWGVDVKAFIDSAPEDSPMSIKPEGVQGKVKFPALKTVDGIECAQVQISITVKPDAINKMPPGFKLEKATAKVSGEMMIPLDPDVSAPAEKMAQQMEFSGTMPAPQGEPLKVSVFHRVIKETSLKSLK